MQTTTITINWKVWSAIGGVLLMLATFAGFVGKTAIAQTKTDTEQTEQIDRNEEDIKIIKSDLKEISKVAQSNSAKLDILINLQRRNNR